MTPLLFPGLVFAAGGAHLLWTSLRMLTFARASLDWPSVEGCVVRLGVNVGTMRAGDETAVVSYTYEVDGVTHESNVYDFGGRAARDGAGDALASHHVGKSVAVYYDPTFPSRATLHGGARFPNYLAVAFGGILSLIGLFCVLGSLTLAA